MLEASMGITEGQSQPTVSQSEPKVSQSVAKMLQSDPRVTQSHLHDHKNDPKAIQKWSKATLICRKWTQSDAKVVPKALQSVPKWGQSVPKSSQSVSEWAQSDPKYGARMQRRCKTAAKWGTWCHSDQVRRATCVWTCFEEPKTKNVEKPLVFKAFLRWRSWDRACKSRFKHVVDTKRGVKVIKICKKYTTCTMLEASMGITEGQSQPKVSQRDPKVFRSVPKLTQSSPKVSQSHFHDAQNDPKATHDRHKALLICRKWTQSDAKVTPKSLQSVPKWRQSVPKEPQSDPKYGARRQRRCKNTAQWGTKCHSEQVSVATCLCTCFAELRSKNVEKPLVFKAFLTWRRVGWLYKSRI